MALGSFRGLVRVGKGFFRAWGLGIRVYRVWGLGLRV